MPDDNILVAILYYSFTKCYHWEKLGKVYKGSLCIIFYNCMWIHNCPNKNVNKKKSLYKHCYWYERNKSTLSSVLILIRCTFWVSRIMVFPFSNVLQPWMLCFWVILETQCSITSCSFPKKHGFSSLKRINIKQSLLPVTQNTWHYLQRKYFSHFRFPFRWVFFTKILL